MAKRKKMNAKCRQSGVTLTEMTVVAAVIALLVTFGLPAIRTFHNSFESGASVRAMISAGLASARAVAAREQHYAGIRFQQDLDGHQYMIFIVHDPTLIDAEAVASPFYNYQANGFRVVEGIKPVKLPEAVGVMEFVNDVGEIVEPNDIIETTTFSVVFSPTGRLVLRNVQVLRRNADDTVFNDPLALVSPMFVDDYDNMFPYQREQSLNRFIVYDRNLFGRLDAAQRFAYLQGLEPININAYTGTIIKLGN